MPNHSGDLWPPGLGGRNVLCRVLLFWSIQPEIIHLQSKVCNLNPLQRNDAFFGRQ
jgi:hypothetical protein